MRTAIKESPESARMTEWLHRSGLNSIDTALAKAHFNRASALVELLFGAASAFRTGMVRLEHSLGALFRRHRAA